MAEIVCQHPVDSCKKNCFKSDFKARISHVISNDLRTLAIYKISQILGDTRSFSEAIYDALEKNQLKLRAKTQRPENTVRLFWVEPSWIEPTQTINIMRYLQHCSQKWPSPEQRTSREICTNFTKLLRALF